VDDFAAPSPRLRTGRAGSSRLVVALVGRQLASTMRWSARARRARVLELMAAANSSTSVTRSEQITETLALSSSSSTA